MKLNLKNNTKENILSHISKVNLEILDLDCLEKAVKNLGGILIRNKKNFEWYGRFVGDSPMPEGLTVDDLGKCDHAIKFPNARYEVGVVKNKKGKGYYLQFDYYHSGGLDKIIGQTGGRLKQNYTKEVTMKAAKVKGYKVTEKEENGKIKLRVLIP